MNDDLSPFEARVAYVLRRLLTTPGSKKSYWELLKETVELICEQFHVTKDEALAIFDAAQGRAIESMH